MTDRELCGKMWDCYRLAEELLRAGHAHQIVVHGLYRSYKEKWGPYAPDHLKWNEDGSRE